MNKQITLEQAVEKVHDGMTIVFGGFLGVESPTKIIDAIVAKGVKNLTIIANDTAYDEVAHSKLVSYHQVKKAIVSHTGTNKQTALQKNEGTLEVEYVPQGTLAERIRVYGAGLDGVLTPTGMGTIMAEGTIGEFEVRGGDKVETWNNTDIPCQITTTSKREDGTTTGKISKIYFHKFEIDF